METDDDGRWSLDQWGYFGVIVAFTGAFAALYANGQLPAAAEQVAVLEGATDAEAVMRLRRYQRLAALRAAGLLAVGLGTLLGVAHYFRD